MQLQRLNKNFNLFNTVKDSHHFHSVIIDELLGRHAVDLIHKALLVGEEVVQLVGQPPTEGDAALVTLV